MLLAGPIHADSAPEFQAAAASLRACGLDVLSPFDANLPDDEADLRAAVAWTAEAVVDADALILLPDWQSSPSCAVQYVAVTGLGRPALTLAQALRTPAGSPGASLPCATHVRRLA